MVERSSIWSTRRGYKVMVINIASHADDCTSKIVIFTNLEKTFDNEAGGIWVLGLEAFKGRFVKEEMGK